MLFSYNQPPKFISILKLAILLYEELSANTLPPHY